MGVAIFTKQIKSKKSFRIENKLRFFTAETTPILIKIDVKGVIVLLCLYSILFERKNNTRIAVNKKS
jgi:hypothetical protein